MLESMCQIIGEIEKLGIATWDAAHAASSIEFICVVSEILLGYSDWSQGRERSIIEPLYSFYVSAFILLSINVTLFVYILKQWWNYNFCSKL